MIKIRHRYTKDVIWTGESIANLGYANLHRADLTCRDLQGADLSCAFLGEADLVGANLRDARLCGAKLCNADLVGADLRGADLEGARLYGADIRGAKLSGAKGLEEARGLNRDLQSLLHAQQGKAYAYKAVAIDMPRRGESRLRFYSPTYTYSRIAYEVGKEVVADSFNDDPREECAPGIHVATLDFVLRCYRGLHIEYLLLEFDPASACIPYVSDGKFRVPRARVVALLDKEETERTRRPVFKKTAALRGKDGRFVKREEA